MNNGGRKIDLAGAAKGRPRRKDCEQCQVLVLPHDLHRLLNVHHSVGLQFRIRSVRVLHDQDDRLPKDEEKRELYEIGKQLFAELGYEEIGMDHFALQSDKLYKATIYIQDPSLEARALKVTLLRKDGLVDPQTIRTIENAILSRARQLRISDDKL